MASSEILAKIGLNSAGFKTGLAKCKLAARSFSGSVGGMFKSVGGQMLGFLGVSAGVAGLGALAKSAIDTGSAISDTATHLRMGTEELQVLQSLARDAGTDFSKLEMSLNNLNLRTVEALDGNKNYREAFERLGISIQDFIKLPTDRKLEQIAKAYAKTGESATALGDVSTLLGQKAGSQLLEVLNRLATEGMDNLSQSAKAAGDIMDAETVVALDNAGDEIARWQNRITVAFGGFLSDMGSAIGRQKWGLIIGLKLAQIGEFVETAFRDISNYILGTFASVGRFINGQFGNFITPIRNVVTDFLIYCGEALSKIVGYFDSGWERAINKAVNSLDKLRNESNKISEKDKDKNFSDIFSEEISNAQTRNKSRARSDVWSSGSVDWYKAQIESAEKLRAVEKKAAEETEKSRKAKYAKADADTETNSQKFKDGKGKKSQTYNDSSLAKIGGGGLTATRYDVSEKQLNESKKQSKLLTKIAENTEKQNSQNELLMR